jgi:hypothetical protein
MVTERVHAIAQRVGGKFIPEDIGLWPELYQAASEALRGLNAPHPMSHRQAAQILNAELATKRGAGVEEVEILDLTKVDIPRQAPVTAQTRTIPNGYYTVEFPNGDYRTLKVSPWESRGIQMVSYLCGPDNTTDYKGFAELDGTASRLWRNFREDTILARALDILTAAEDRSALTEGFARRSGRCSRCGRVLTVPSSLNAGLGPECAKAG